ITDADLRFKTFKEYGKAGKVLVCGDGDLVINAVSPQGKPNPLGYDPFSRQTFGNKDFVLHAVDFMLNEKGLITARNKQIVLRPLNKVKIRDERLLWQSLNMLAPILLTVIFGILWNSWRKRKYTVKKQVAI
ncbi:MAG: gliding motility-associated ABC transporter substrate-binding protein GldG, partial [Verrucomicrobia bacterium]|nr:gliding motility-associated ABC transporter substrate-binding protein GldG [Cytophagales bacterium]